MLSSAEKYRETEKEHLLGLGNGHVKNSKDWWRSLVNNHKLSYFIAVNRDLHILLFIQRSVC